MDVLSSILLKVRGHVGVAKMMLRAQTGNYKLKECKRDKYGRFKD
jgi:hypothetical protein